jgi:hypothetical protein
MSDLDKMKKIFDLADKVYEEFEDSEGSSILALPTEDDDETIEFVFDEDGRFRFIRKEI